MTYRDDRDADRARIEALEAELAAAKRELAVARGDAPSTALVKTSGGMPSTLAVADGSAKKWYGPPLESEIRVEYDGEYPADKFEDLIARIRNVSRDRGQAELLKSSVSWASTLHQRHRRPYAIVTVTVRGGRTELLMQLHLGVLAGGIYGGVGGGVGGGLIGAPIAIPIATGMPVLIPVLLVGWAGLTFAGCKWLYARFAKRQGKKFQDLFRVLDTEIRETLAAVAKP